MCLIVTARFSGSDATRAEEIRRAAGLPPERPLFHFSRRQSDTINIPGPDGGCGCSFLAESADWNAPSWDMESSTLPRLEQILRAISAQTSGEFAFDALWVGEAPNEERRISFEDLIELVRESKLGTSTRYTVIRDSHAKADQSAPPSLSLGSLGNTRV